MTRTHPYGIYDALHDKDLQEALDRHPERLRRQGRRKLRLRTPRALRAARRVRRRAS